MRSIRSPLVPLLMALVFWSARALGAEPVNVAPLLRQLRAVREKGVGNRQAMVAWRQLSKADASQLPEILSGIDGVGPLAANWIRAAADTVAERALKRGDSLPTKRLETFLLDTAHSPRARRWAYECIARVDDSAAARLIPDRLNDPSIELRRDAVALLLAEAKELAQSDQQPDATAAYRKALLSARDVDQIQSTAATLRELGEEVDLPKLFGFLMRWKLIAPFDNKDGIGFDKPYRPESEIDLGGVYRGTTGDVKWIDHTTTDSYGVVDLNSVLGRHKGAVAYGYTEFTSHQQRDVEFRLGSKNAHRLWLNGRQLTANEVYHAGMEIDQYTTHGSLKEGRNTILLKICQNEQTQSWAQDWNFQLRVCDAIGGAILSTNRAVAAEQP